MKFLNQNKLVLILSSIIILLFLLNLRQCNSAKIVNKKLEVVEQNNLALQDTIRLTKNNNGELEFNKLALLTNNIENLTKLNAKLAEEVKTIKGKVSTIISGDIKIVHDTILLDVKTEVTDSNIISNFKYDTTYSEGNSRVLQGFTNYNIKTKESAGKLVKDSIQMSFITGIKNLNTGKPEIFLTSNYPGFIATRLDGAVLDPKLFEPKNKQKLITIGANIGFIPITYDLKTQKVDLNPTRIGGSIGININLLKLITKK